jgi:hypothetical protein
MLALGGFILLIVWASRTRQRQHAERERAAASKGWRYEANPSSTQMYRVTGRAAGLDWQLVADNGGEDDSSSTTWSTDAVHLPDLELMIHACGPHEHMKGTWGQVTLNLAGALTDLAGLPRPQMLDLLRTGIEHRAERTAVRENFTILARDEHLARCVITPDVEDALARWAMCPTLGEHQRRSLTVDLGPTDLRASCAGVVTAGEAMTVLAQIGSALADAYFRAGVPHAAVPQVAMSHSAR